MKLRRTVLFFSITILLFSFARSSLAKSEGNGQFEGKKVLYINSYHEGYPWSDGIIRGIQRIFNSTGIHLETQYMDTKRNVDESFKKQAGTNAKLKIDTLNPDIVIVADDNASKYVIVPYYMNKTLPFVFCGVNWDASAYGFPADNVTGMIEVSLISQLIDSLKGYAKGDRIGLIGADNLSNRKEAKNYKDKLKVSLTKEVFVSTMNEWRKAFIDIQKKVDMLIVAPPSFLSNDLEKIEFETFIYT